jgi:hypothetical protein
MSLTNFAGWAVMTNLSVVGVFPIEMGSPCRTTPKSKENVKAKVGQGNRDAVGTEEVAALEPKDSHG